MSRPHPSAQPFDQAQPSKPAPADEYVDLQIIQASGRFDGPVWAWAKYLARKAEEQNATALSLTEVQQRDAQEAFRFHFPAETWRIQVYREHYVITRKAHVGWQRDAKGSVVKSKPLPIFGTKIPGLADWRQMKVAAFRYRLLLTGGTPMRILPFHAPAEVQAGGKWNTSSLRNRLQVFASKRGFKRLGNNCRRWFRSHPRGLQIALGDGNLDVKMPVWMEWLINTLGGTAAWSRAKGNRGTHDGGRRIDIAHIWGAKVLSAEVLDTEDDPTPHGFDHDAWVFSIRVPVRRAA